MRTVEWLTWQAVRLVILYGVGVVLYQMGRVGHDGFDY